MKSQYTLIAMALLHATSPVNAFSILPESSYPARITGQFLTGHDQQLGGFGDLMLPIIGHENSIFFTDGGILLGQNQRHTYSAGLGYRQITEMSFGSGVLGAFAFADYFDTQLNNQFWLLNPGFEWLTTRYEARLQGYIPLNSRKQIYLNTFASSIPQNVLADSGRVTTQLFAAMDHSIIDTPVGLVQQAGTGGELELGRFIDLNQGMWVRMGGYHFNYSNSKNINGLQANVEMAINRHLSLIVQDNYDNQNKNLFAVGLRMNLGGADAARDSLQYQMTSPIIRHQSRQSYGEAVPSRQNFKGTGPSFNRFSNVWFFSPSGAAPVGAATKLANCTAEHPCTTIDTPTVQKINQLSPQANLFFASGNYQIPKAGNSRWVNLNGGQSLWGRNPGWLTSAVGLDRPLINGGLVWGNQHNDIYSLESAKGAVYDLRIQNINQVTPSGVFILSENIFSGSTTNSSFVGGAVATGDLLVSNSEIEVVNDNDNSANLAFGTAAKGNITVENSSVTATMITHGLDPAGNLTGSFGAFGFSGKISNSSIKSNVIGGQTQAFGIYTSSMAKVDNSKIVTTAYARANAFVTSGSITAHGISSGNGVINHTAVLTTTNTDGYVLASGLISGGEGFNGVLNVNNSSITVLTNAVPLIEFTSNSMYGILASSVTINQSIVFVQYIDSSFNSGQFLNRRATASGIAGTSDVTFLKDSRITVDVSSVISSAIGVDVDLQSVVLNNTTIIAKSLGNLNAATGIHGHSVEFTGNASSFIKALATGGTAIPIDALTIRNNSNPKSQCSANGVDFVNC
ncbi:MAG: hypothetical protein PSV35_00015 [bacterium]|nr:hypothetical protein [bacterium]